MFQVSLNGKTAILEVEIWLFYVIWLWINKVVSGKNMMVADGVSWPRAAAVLRERACQNKPNSVGLFHYKYTCERTSNTRRGNSSKWNEETCPFRQVADELGENDTPVWLSVKERTVAACDGWLTSATAPLCSPTSVNPGVRLRFDWFLLFCFVCLFIFLNQKCVLIRLEKDEESAAGRLMLWLHSVVPAAAPPPKTTATDHIRSAPRAPGVIAEGSVWHKREKRWRNRTAKAQLVLLAC